MERVFVKERAGLFGDYEHPKRLVMRNLRLRAIGINFIIAACQQSWDSRSNIGKSSSIRTVRGPAEAICKRC